MEVFRLPVIAGQTFTRTDVRLDGKRFEKCKFINCQIFYSGGLAEASACEFSPDTVWRFEGAAGITMAVLQQLGWRFQYGKEGAAPIPLGSA
jgi:hypothetical protein